MIPRSLGARLFAAFLVVVVAALGTVGFAVLLTGPQYFAEEMGHQLGAPIGDAMAHAMKGAFVDAMTQTLIAALVIAIATATVISMMVAARIARPVTLLAGAAHRIAGGHYAERVATDQPGELRDLATSFNEMASSLEATERRRLQLVGDIAHELRTPLTTIDGYLEGIEDGVVRPDPATLRLLRAETGRLTRLVDDLADLWRVESHQLPIHLARLDAALVARDVVNRFEPRARSDGITLRAPTDPVQVFADRDRLEQILSNYVSNALRHAPPGSTVTVGAEPAGPTALLWVADEGQGLAANQLELVFERFYRIDAARARASGGAGIGLAIVRALAEAMGGRAWAESGGIGTGAAFLVELPAAGADWDQD